MKNELQMTAMIIDENRYFTFEEVCTMCQINSDGVVQLVQYAILSPQGETPEAWRFSGIDLQRTQKALRLQHDLQINLEGLGLVLDLLDEVEDLRQTLHHLETLYTTRHTSGS